MVSRGVPQLKNIRLYFCDFGGSSKGVRQALQSPEASKFFEQNPHLKLELYMKRNYHPYMSSTYINGYVKDQSLKSLNEDQVISWLEKVNSEYGRRPLKHNCVKVQSEIESVQGVWQETLWNQYPKHMMETKKTIPSAPVESIPLRPVMEKKVRPHRQTAIARKKFPVIDQTKL